MTINCKGNLIDFETPKIMGILNLTPDSFYDGGSYKSDKQALSQVEKMLNEGATFIDIGGQSTRPTSTWLEPEKELRRVLPVLDVIIREFPKILVSIDTFYAKVAEETVQHGAAIINDISAGNLDDKMFSTIGKLRVPYIIMHMRGKPQTMQTLTQYDDLIRDILYYFSEKVNKARALGINDLIVDPGFGFSKTKTQNFKLLKELELFKTLDLPILMGVSHKSTIYKTLNIKPEQALNGTTALNMISLINGAHILRVHEVREAMECVELFLAYTKA